MQTEIPEDVMKAAADAILRGGSSVRIGNELHVSIARAIMAERYRCAQLCDAERERRLASNYPAVRIHDFAAVAAKLAKQIKSGEFPPKQEA